MTAVAVAARDGATPASPRSSSSPRSALRRPELAVLARRSRCRSRSGSRLARAPELRGPADVDARARARGDELDVELDGLVGAAGRAARARARRPGRARGRGRRERAVAPPRLGRRADARAEASAAPAGGATDLGDVRLRARDRLGLVVWEGALDRKQRLRVYPRPRRCAGSSSLVATQLFTGNEVAREKGEGIEFADLRLFAPGDRVRSINWRASARAGRAGRQRAASRAERGRDPLPRHVRRRARAATARRSTSPCARPRRSRRATSSAATASGSSPSAASCAG